MKKCLVQIYEIQRPEEAEALLDIGVDHIGSVLLSGQNWKDPSIKTVVDITQAAALKASLIPLFDTAAQVATALDYYRPDMVHFCESLTGCGEERGQLKHAFEIQRFIRERFPEIKIMRSIPIAPTGCIDLVPSLSLAQRFEEISDFFLTDTLIVNEGGNSGDLQPVSGFVGITGKTCDWEVAARLVRQSRIPVILAGGISPDNVVAGICRVNPAGVDSCTRTNATDESGAPLRFQKDLNKVKDLVEKVRLCEKERDTDGTD